MKRRRIFPAIVVGILCSSLEWTSSLEYTYTDLRSIRIGATDRAVTMRLKTSSQFKNIHISGNIPSLGLWSEKKDLIRQSNDVWSICFAVRQSELGALNEVVYKLELSSINQQDPSNSIGSTRSLNHEDVCTLDIFHHASIPDEIQQNITGWHDENSTSLQIQNFRTLNRESLRLQEQKLKLKRSVESRVRKLMNSGLML